MKLNNINNRKLKDATLIKVGIRSGGTKYQLCLVYEEKDNLGNLHEITLKGVPLPLCDNFMITEKYYEPGAASKSVINVGYGDINAWGWNTHSNMVDTIVEYAPTKEMTIGEIEKELGYKVKIVNREDTP